MHKIEILSERYILLDSLIFKLNIEKERAVLAIPEVCVDQIIALHHSSFFAGHKGVIKTYLTMSDKFFIPGSHALFKILHQRLSHMSTFQ